MFHERGQSLRKIKSRDEKFIFWTSATLRATRRDATRRHVGIFPRLMTRRRSDTAGEIALRDRDAAIFKHFSRILREGASWRTRDRKIA